MQSKELIQISESQFGKDLSNPMYINGAASSRGYYNLVVSMRDVRLYNAGIKPHRNWKVTDVKRYFGINGNTATLLSKLEEIKDIIKG
jgi:hypothetical protein